MGCDRSIEMRNFFIRKYVKYMSNMSNICRIYVENTLHILSQNTVYKNISLRLREKNKNILRTCSGLDFSIKMHFSTFCYAFLRKLSKKRCTESSNLNNSTCYLHFIECE